MCGEVAACSEEAGRSRWVCAGAPPMELTVATCRIRPWGAELLLRILVLGAVEIGSMYAGKLLQGGHEVLLWPAVRVWSTCKPTD